jgi:hypothetical protein
MLPPCTQSGAGRSPCRASIRINLNPAAASYRSKRRYEESDTYGDQVGLDRYKDRPA